jgi:hypothetical protein
LGASSTPSSPWSFQPTESSQVRGDGRSLDLDTAGLSAARQPSNASPEEYTSGDFAIHAPCFAGVVQDVDERVAHRGGRREDPRVVAVLEHAPGALPELVEPAHDPHGEPDHAASESALVLGLDDEMEVVRLDRVLDDPERLTRGCDEGRLEQRVRVVGPQAPQARAQTHRHEHRMPRLEPLALRV